MSKWKCILQKQRLKVAQSQAYCPVLNHLKWLRQALCNISHYSSTWLGQSIISQTNYTDYIISFFVGHTIVIWSCNKLHWLSACFRTWWINVQCRSMWINVYSNRIHWSKMSLNEDQCRTIWNNSSQCWSREDQGPLDPHWTALISIGISLAWSTLNGIDQHLYTLIGIGNLSNMSNADQCGSMLFNVDPANVDQCWSMPVNVDQWNSMPFSGD